MKKLVLLIFLLFIDSSFCHVPTFSNNSNTDLLRALMINDPLKSVVVYDEIESYDSKYYSFYLNASDRLVLSLITPDADFYPGMILMVPELNGYSMILLNPDNESVKEFEPFIPSSYYNLVNFDEVVNNSGQYYIIIHSKALNGKFGLTVGYVESFTFIEWIKIPFDAIFIHSWEGQNLLIIFSPLILSIIAGSVYCIKKSKKHNWEKIVGMVSFFFYIGSGLMILLQMIINLIPATFSYSFIITLVFASLPIFFGLIIFKIVNKKKIKRDDGIKLILLGGLGIAFWAGFLVAPIIVIILGIKKIN